MTTYEIIPTINEFCVDKSNPNQSLHLESSNNIRSLRPTHKRDVIFDPNIIIDLILESKAQNFGFQIHSPNSERAYPIVGMVAANSLADRAGLKSGWKILSTNRTCLYKITSKELKLLMTKNKKLGYMKMKLFSDDKEYSDLKEPIHLKAPPLKKSTTGSIIKSSLKKLKSSFKRRHKKQPDTPIEDKNENESQIRGKIIEPVDQDIDILLKMCDSVDELKQHQHEDTIYYLTPLLSNLNDALRHSIDSQPSELDDIQTNEILADDDIFSVFNLYDKMLNTVFKENHASDILNEVGDSFGQVAKLNELRNDHSTNETYITITNGNADEIGLTIVKENQCIIISRILKNSFAEKTGQLSVGDEILEINQIPIKGLSIEDVLNVLNQEKKRGLSFLIKSQSKQRRNMSFCVDKSNSIKNESKYVKALFNYSVEDDEQARCKEIGINFSIGDILEIVDRTDLFYWQAKKVIKNKDAYTTDDNTKIGLIPSRNYYQNVLKNILNYSSSNEMATQENTINCFSCFQKNYQSHQLSSESNENIIEKYECGYQDIILISPDPFNCRPVFLISPNIELSEVLVNCLLERIPHICQRPTLYTTKSNTEPSNHRSTEVVSKFSFERALNHHQFIGVTQSTNNHLAGYSIRDIWNLSQHGKVCLVATDDCNIGRYYRSGLRPFLVLIQVVEDLSNTQGHSRPIRNFLSDHLELFDKIQPFMDSVICHNNATIEATVAQLEDLIINTLNTPLWVPAISEIHTK